MTRLTIIPNVEKKRLTFDGKIASGEHVELRVYDFADKIEEGRLRVRAVDFQGNTLAVFPVKSRDENGDVEKDENGNDVWEQWGRDEDYEYATCVFNLNTIPALKYFRRGGECLIVLDDPESNTLYGSGHLCVLPWPKEVGKDEPVDLDAYPDNIKDFARRLDDAEDNVENCRRDVESALSFASNANTNANTAVLTAQNALAASSEAKIFAVNAFENSAAAKKAAQDAEGLVAAAQNAAQDAKDAVGKLADVARSGSYSDLSNKPQIPSIEGLAKKTEVDHVENVLRGELNGEISRAKAAEMALGASVNSKAEATALTSERQRAEAAEASIRKDLEGKASLDGSGKVPASQLPSYVDDVLEFASESRFPRPGEGGKIYIATDTNKQYRWSGTKYAEISSSLALGETEQTAYPGDKGAANALAIAQESARALSAEDLIRRSIAEFLKDASLSSDGTTLKITKKDGTEIVFSGFKPSEEQLSLLAGGPYQKTGEFGWVEGEFVVGPSIDGHDGAIVVNGGDGAGRIVVNDGTGGEVKASIKKGGKEVATEEQVTAVSDKVDDIKSTVSTDNRFLVGGSYSEPPAEGSPTTAAIQTRENEDAEWVDQIRVDKGYDALTGSTMVKLDKSVQTVTVAGSNLVIEIPESVDGTVRDLCVYANNSSDGDTALTFPAGTYYGDDPNGAVAKAGKVTAIYLTEIPKGAWMLRIEELEQHEVTT